MTGKKYDVFLSYNSIDRDFVRGEQGLDKQLQRLGLECFVDARELHLGQNWVDELQEALANSRAVAICLGRDELGRWQKREVFWALDQQTLRAGFPVIPVLLPNAEPPVGFLQQLMWLDLRQPGKPSLRLADEDFQRQLERLADAIRGSLPTAVNDSSRYFSPYRGLKAFREEDAAVFFGRDKYTDNLLDLVGANRLVAVTGASGSGKSSVVQAGLLPKLRRIVRGPAVWEIATMMPQTDPLKSLAAAFQPLIRPDLEDDNENFKMINECRDNLAKRKLKLDDLVLMALKKQPQGARLLLVVDQWEELYTLCKDESLREEFINSVLATIAMPHVRLTVVFTIRWDFYGKVLSNRLLLDAIGKSRLDVGPMNSAELRQVIEGPAKETGLKFESGLVQRILEAAERDASSLPLLEFLLHQLWEKKNDDNELTHQVYQDAGELQGAIGRYADDYYENRFDQDKMLNETERAACGSLFRQLVRAGLDAAQDTRRRADMSKLTEAEQSAARKLIDARLLISGAGSSDTDASRPQGTVVRTVEVSHEELLRRWDRLRGWVNEDREFLQWQTSLETQLKEFLTDPTALLRGRRLQDARKYFAKRADDLNPEERQLVEDSIQADEKRQRDEAEEQRLKEQRELELQKVKTQRRKLLQSMALALCFLAMVVWYIVKSRGDQLQAAQLVAEYLRDPTEFLLQQMQGYRSRVVPLLETAFKSEDRGGAERLHAAVGLMAFEPTQELGAEILKRLADFTSADFGPVRAALMKGSKEQREAWQQDLRGRLEQAANNRALQLRCLWMSGLLGDWEQVNTICAVDEDPTERTEFIHDAATLLAPDPRLLAEVAGAEGASALPADTQSACCLILGDLGPSAQTVQPQLFKLFENSPAAGVHAAARWALRQQGIGAAVLDRRIVGKSGPDWEVTADKDKDGKPLTAFTMVRIRGLQDGGWLGSVTDGKDPGEKGAGEPDAADRRPIAEFWMADREVTVQQFREIFPEHPELSVTNASDSEAGAQSTPPSGTLQPVLNVSWYDAVIFCNRLSERCGLIPYYEATETGNIDENGSPRAGMQPPKARAGGANGYRLASEREWEWACRAGSRVPWSCGRDSARVSDYAAFYGSAAEVASKRPAGNGLFDMHGNAREWVEDYVINFFSCVLRGGSFRNDYPAFFRCAGRILFSPDDRDFINGFRISRTK